MYHAPIVQIRQDWMTLPMQLDVHNSIADIPREDRTVDQIYALLSGPFAESDVMSDTRGGVTFPYITGEACARRMNDVLGPNGWSVRVLEHGINPEADEVWVLVEVDAIINGQHVVRQQFGSQKLRRSRSTGMILDIGFDLKGAETDGMKKCCSLFGVALYLAYKPNPKPIQNQQPPARPAPQMQHQANPAPPPPAPAAHVTPIDPNEMIRSLDHPVVKRLVKLKNEAVTLGVMVPAFKLPETRANLIRAGMLLKVEVDKKTAASALAAP